MARRESRDGGRREIGSVLAFVVAVEVFEVLRTAGGANHDELHAVMNKDGDDRLRVKHDSPRANEMLDDARVVRMPRAPREGGAAGPA